MERAKRLVRQVGRIDPSPQNLKEAIQALCEIVLDLAQECSEAQAFIDGVETGRMERRGLR